MNRLRHRLPVAAAATFALLIIAAMAAPLATALESTDTTLVDDTTDTTTETTTDTTDDTTTVLDDPSPSPSPTEDSTLDSTVEDTSSTIDSTVETVDDTSEELISTTEETLSPSEEPAEEPSDGTSNSGTTDDGATTDSGDTNGTSSDSAGTATDNDGSASSTSESQTGSDEQTQAAGSATREADQPVDREARLREAARLMERLRRLWSSRVIDAMIGTTYEGPSQGWMPVRYTDDIDPRSVFVIGPQLDAPVFTFGGVQPYDRRPGRRSTHDILSRLSEAGADLQTAAKVLAPFPVIGPATYSDDWHYPRDGGARLHKGTDIFAQRGTPIVAVADGVIGKIGVRSGLGGNTIGLYADDGTYYYYAHLDAFAAHIEFNLRVEKGEIIGFVGDSGNAAGTPPHLHFQIHPNDGAPVPPVTYLDRWLEEARAKVLLVRSNSSLGQLPPLVAPPAAVAESAGSAQNAPAGSDPAQGQGTAAERFATSPTGYTRQEDTSQAIAVVIALTGVGWYLLRRRSVFAGSSSVSEVAVVPDVLEPVLTVEDVIRAGEPATSGEARRDVLEPVLQERGPQDDRAGSDVLAGLLS